MDNAPGISYIRPACAQPRLRFGEGRPARARPVMMSNAMRLSEYFLPTLKETPAEAQIVSHRLMLRAGMIRQSSAGIYSWLPLGFRVRKKIEQIVGEEQAGSGCQALLIPITHRASSWRESPS